MATFSSILGGASGRRRAPRARRLGIVALTLVSLGPLWSGFVEASDPPSAKADDGDDDDRLRRLEALVGDLAGEVKRLSEENRRLTERIGALSVPPADPRVAPAQADETLPAALPDAGFPESQAEETTAPPEIVAAPNSPDFASTMSTSPADTLPEGLSSLFESGGDPATWADTSTSLSARPFLAGLYDKGFVLVAPNDQQRTPFALKFNLTTQLRYAGFVRTVETWTDSSGRVLPVVNQSNFALNRAWFTFSGFGFSPKLKYLFSVFTTSTTNTTVAIGFAGYEFSKAFSLSGGYYKVPGTREWLESARYPLGAERTMANTFFRPSISPGVWIDGEPLDNLYYYAGIFNDFNATHQIPNRPNTNMTYSGNLWWEPLGSFGPGYSDEEFHDDLAMRTGTSLTYTRSLREPDLGLGVTNPENTILRLSDGTPLFQLGALAPGVTLNAANVMLWSYDLSFKRRGFSLSGEYYARWIYGLNASGPGIPRKYLNMFDTGGLAQFSYALVPKRFEVFGRTSMVAGPFGDASEYGGGANWYIFANRNVRGTFEAKRVNHSPADNPLYNYIAGQSGMLYQLQLLTDF